MNELIDTAAFLIGYCVLTAGGITLVLLIVFLLSLGAWRTLNAVYGISVVLRLISRQDLLEMSKHCEKLKASLDYERNENLALRQTLVHERSKQP